MMLVDGYLYGLLKYHLLVWQAQTAFASNPATPAILEASESSSASPYGGIA